LKHFASPDFWKHLDRLPPDVQKSAKENYELLKTSPRHRSLHFKRVGRYWSVRVTRGYRALGVDIDEGILWGWIGSHGDYDKIISGS
jgi:hypothetical protein